MTSTVGVSQLKAALSDYLARVQAGEEVVVTERGLPIARLVPVRTGEEELASLEQEGLVRLPAEELAEDFWEFERPRDPEGTVRAALLEERREGR